MNRLDLAIPLDFWLPAASAGFAWADMAWISLYRLGFIRRNREESCTLVILHMCIGCSRKRRTALAHQTELNFICIMFFHQSPSVLLFCLLCRTRKCSFCAVERLSRWELECLAWASKHIICGPNACLKLTFKLLIHYAFWLSPFKCYLHLAYT